LAISTAFAAASSNPSVSQGVTSKAAEVSDVLKRLDAGGAPRKLTEWVDLQAAFPDHPVVCLAGHDLQVSNQINGRAAVSGRTHSFASSSLVPCNLTINGMVRWSSLVALMIPSAMTWKRGK
jgi:hypothetical protein